MVLAPLAFQKPEMDFLDTTRRKTYNKYVNITSLNANEHVHFVCVSQIEEKYWAHRRGSDAKSFSLIGSPGTSPDAHNEAIPSLGDSFIFSSIDEPSQPAKTQLATSFEIEKEKQEAETNHGIAVQHIIFP
jgi:hypothetical protein